MARLMPGPIGWRLSLPLGGMEEGTEARALCEGLGSGVPVEVLLPSSSLVLERLQLPVAEEADLHSMAQLQLEKLLPYASEEFVFDLQKTGRREGEGESEQLELSALSVSQMALEAACREVREMGRGPVNLGVYSWQLADALRDETGVVCLIWEEFKQPFVALVEKGVLLWLEGLPAVEPEWVELEVSKAILGAELAGVPVEVARVKISSECGGWAPGVRRALPGVPIEEGELGVAEEVRGRWMPLEWAREEEGRAKRQALWEKMQWVGLAYLLALTLGFGWLALQKSGLRRLDAQLAELQPEVEASKASQNRWTQLQPAIDPSRFLVEILAIIQGAIGPADIKITEFKMGVRDFSVAGEAASLAEAIEYASRLRKDPGFAGFQIQSPNPNILPNERAQFRILAKSENSPALAGKR